MPSRKEVKGTQKKKKAQFKLVAGSEIFIKLLCGVTRGSLRPLRVLVHALP